MQSFPFLKKPDAGYYRVSYREGYAVIVDEDGKAIDHRIALQVAREVIRTVERPAYVYVGVRPDGLWKIGMSLEPARRAKELSIEIKYMVKCQRFGNRSASRLEKLLLDFFDLVGLRVEGEWFNFDALHLDVVAMFCKAGSPHAFIEAFRSELDALGDLLGSRETWDEEGARRFWQIAYYEARPGYERCACLYLLCKWGLPLIQPIVPDATIEHFNSAVMQLENHWKSQKAFRPLNP